MVTNCLIDAKNTTIKMMAKAPEKDLATFIYDHCIAIAKACEGEFHLDSESVEAPKTLDLTMASWCGRC